jgi:hypothetical protein
LSIYISTRYHRGWLTRNLRRPICQPRILCAISLVKSWQNSLDKFDPGLFDSAGSNSSQSRSFAHLATRGSRSSFCLSLSLPWCGRRGPATSAAVRVSHVPAALRRCQCACAVVSSLSALTLFFLPRQRCLREPQRSLTRLTAHEPTTSRPRCDVAFLRRWPSPPISRAPLPLSFSLLFLGVCVLYYPCSLT